MVKPESSGPGSTSDEDLTRFDGGAGYRGDQLRLERIGKYAAMRFAGHEKDPFDATTEVRAFVESWSDKHLNEIGETWRTIEGQPALSGVRVYPNVPVAAGQENLASSLSLYATQNIGRTSMEVILFANQVTGEDGQVVTSEIADTLRAVDQFRETPNAPNVRICHRTYDSRHPMGKIRADGWDVMLFDLYQGVGFIDNDVVGLSQDADPRGMSPSYASGFERFAVEHPLADIMTTELKWHLEGDPNSDPNRILGYWEYLRQERGKIIGRFPIPEATTAIRLGSYAAVGGFGRDRPTREMIDLQQRMVNARREPEEGTPYVQLIDDIYVSTDSRRAYDAIRAGHAPHRMWDDRPFFTGIDPVRINDPGYVRGQEPVGRDALRNILGDLERTYLEDRLPPEQAEALRAQGRERYGFVGV